MSSLALHKPHHHPTMAFSLLSLCPWVSLFPFLLQSPGDWNNLLGEEDLKGVSMATAGPAPYQSVLENKLHGGLSDTQWGKERDLAAVTSLGALSLPGITPETP